MKQQLGYLLALAACSEAPRQALVMVELEPGIATTLDYVEVNALQSDGGVRGSGARLALAAAYFRERRVSFGAVPDARGELLLRFRGFDAAHALRLEQTFTAVAQAAGKTQFSFTLADECLDQIPCSLGRCTPTLDERACAEPEEDSCLLGTIVDCGTCGAACSLRGVSVAACADGQCLAECEAGYEDCDRDPRSNGCEIDVLRDPEHCGGCARPACPFGSCSDGLCTHHCDGYTVPSSSITLRTLPPNRMVGTKIRVEGEGYLAALGVSLPTGPEYPDTRFRLALYENTPKTDVPMRLVDQTSEMSVRGLERDGSKLLQECGGLEMLVANRRRIANGDYWLFLIASAPLQVHARAIEVLMTSSLEDVDYATLQYMPEYPHLPSVLKVTPGLDPKVYVVRTPLER